MQAARGASLSHSDQAGPANEQARRPRGGGRYLATFGCVAALAYAVDLVTKIVAVEQLTGSAPVQVVGHYFTFYLTRNPGAAFSAGTSYTMVLSFIAIGATLVVLWTARRLGSVGWSLGLGLLLGGILGNLTDRIFRSPAPLEGHVVDFLMFPNFPVFNFADVWINLAAGFIIVQAIRGIRVDGRPHDPDPEDG